MKKIKLLSLGFASCATVVAPVVTLASCAKDKNWNLMEEYTPTIKQRVRQSFANVDEVVSTYLDAVAEVPEVFIQDLRYTISRGLPPYNAYVSEFCEIKETKFNMEVDPKSVVVVNTADARTITFEATFDILYDYTGTKPEEMEWYDMNLYRWDSTTKVKFVLDFDTRGFDEIDIHAQRQQMTTLAGATQLGISEINSTAQILSETGTYEDLDHIRHTITDGGTASKAFHFMLPNEQYWIDQEQETHADDINKEVNELWFTKPGLQAIILAIKYYMPSNVQSFEHTPNTFDFGSYYMANATLNDVFTATEIDESTGILHGFNLSLDSINNTDHLNDYVGFKKEDRSLTLPTTVVINSTDHTIVEASASSFDATASKYTNFGLPKCVEKLIIPAEYENIGINAFQGNSYLTSIKFEHGDGVGQQYPTVSKNAFGNLLALNYVDLSDFNPAEYAAVRTAFNAEPFENVHKGLLDPADGKHGTIKLPDGWKAYENNWEDTIETMGFVIYDDTTDPVTPGWVLK